MSREFKNYLLVLSDGQIKTINLDPSEVCDTLSIKLLLEATGCRLMYQSNDIFFEFDTVNGGFEAM